MKERPILFSAPMVRALLDGTKTQTRRAVKPTGWNPSGPGYTGKTRVGLSPEPVGLQAYFEHQPSSTWHGVPCPYGKPGDRLWVREAFDFLPAGGPDQPQACEIVYWATGSHEPRTAPIDYNPMIYGHEKVRPSIHMPRWASRITLEVTAVRVERLKGISYEDALAEGMPDHRPLIESECTQGETADECARRLKWPQREYMNLWNAINGPGSWGANPWVWVVEFKKLKGPTP